MGNIDDILSGESAEEVVEATEPEQAEPEPQAEGQPRDETGKFAPKGEEESASPAPAEEDPPYEHAAVKGERERRQKAESERDELRQQLESLQKPAEPPRPPANMWEDEEAWQAEFQNTTVAKSAWVSKLDTSKMLMLQSTPDFKEMEPVWEELAKANPALVDEAAKTDHPWKKAYEIAKNHQRMQELGAIDVTSLTEKLREEIMAEMASTTPATRLPPTLSGERNVGDRKGPEWGGPKPLDELLK